MRTRVLAIVGPTAAGKSALAIVLAPALGAEIVSVDSAMIYRGMDIGTDAPSGTDLARVPHHLVGVVEPSVTLSASDFQAMARQAIQGIASRGRTPLLAGGSGLWFRAAVDPLDFPPTDPAVRAGLEGMAGELGAGGMWRRLEQADPEAARRIDPANLRRTVRALEVIELTGRAFSSYQAAWGRYESVYDLVVVGLTWPRPELDRRIEARVDRQIERGLVAEVEGLVTSGLRSSLTSVQALGYRQILDLIDGRITLEEAVTAIKARTRRFARRQLTWFGADPRVAWFEADPASAAGLLAHAARAA